MKNKQRVSGTPLYGRWKGMKQRCYNPNNRYYYNYGGRGIKICQRWLDSFENFYNDMKEGFEVDLELNRIDNNGNYEPQNCNWVTRKQNSNNKRTNLVFKGETATQASQRLAGRGNSNIVSNRIRKGWDIERAFTEPKHKETDNSTIEWTDEEKEDCMKLNWKEFSKLYNRNYQAYIQKRFRIRHK